MEKRKVFGGYFLWTICFVLRQGKGIPIGNLERLAIKNRIALRDWYIFLPIFGLLNFRPAMQMKIILFFLLLTTTIFGQEIGHVKNGKYSVKLLKSDNLFSWVYSDVNSKTAIAEKSFNFPNKETIYNIILDGFENKNNHQIIVQTDHDTIVKFEYKKIKGEMRLNISHNNLNKKTVGTSISLSREQLMALFGLQA